MRRTVLQLTMAVLPVPMYKEKTITARNVLKLDYNTARLIKLNNPKKLNSFSSGMISWLRDFYIHYPHLEDVMTMKSQTERGSGCVYVITGEGDKSFCAGGDVVAMCKQEPLGAFSESVSDEIQLYYYLWHSTHGNLAQIPPFSNYRNVRFDRGEPAPFEKERRNAYVALWNGYVMGGGVGLSLHGQYRVACPQTVFAMPETSIGFFPDVGAGYFLPRLDRPSEYHRGDGVPGLGLYLGLLGARVKGADLIHAGLATHFVPDLDAMRQLQEALCQAGPAEVEAILETHSVARKDLPPFTLAPVAPMLQRVFSLSPETTVEKVVTALEEEAKNTSQPKEVKELAQNALFKMTGEGNKEEESRRESFTLSPTSLIVTLDLLQKGALDDSPSLTHEREFHGALNCGRGPSDLHEGVRALLVDKDQKPKWNPPSLSKAYEMDLPVTVFSDEGHPKFDKFVSLYA